MRRILSVLVAFVTLSLVAGPLSAQGWTFGFEGGVNVFSFSLDPDDDLDVDTRTGIVAGGALRYGFGSEGVVGIRTGAYWSAEGSGVAVLGPGARLDQEIELFYLRVPLLVSVEPITGASSVRPRFYAGGSVGLELSCGLTSRSPTTTLSGPCDDEGNFDAGIFDTEGLVVGLAIGAGVDLAAGPGAITLDGRYGLGLTDINATREDVSGADQTEVKNRVLSVTAGYSFPLR